MIHGHPPQPQQQQAHPHMAHPPPPAAAHQVPPPHLAHLTSVPPPNVPQPGSMPQQQQQHPPAPPQTREHHSGPRINNRHHHHPRVPTGGDHHQSMSAGPHMPLQGSRKPPSQHYGTSNGMAHGGGMGSKHQHSGMGHPPKTLPYNSSSSSNSSSHQHQQQQQHHHQQHNHHSHHSHPAGHHNTGSIPVVSAAGPGASKARMIPSHEPKIIHTHSNTAPVGSNTQNSSNVNAIVVHQTDPVQQQLSGGISSSTATTTPGTTIMSSNTAASAPSSTGSVPAVMGGSGGGGGGGGGGSAGVIPASTAGTVVVMGNASDSNQKDSTIIHQSILLSSVPETLANTKEKTPMCLVNELARYNKIQHQYRLTGESGPAHKKRFTVTLKLGDEEYTAEGPSIKKAQHSAAHEAIGATKYKHPPAKTNRTKTGGKTSIGNITPTVELNALAMKRGEPTVYETEQVVTAPKYPVNSHPPGAPNTPQQGGAGSHNFYSAPPPGTHYGGGYHRSNSMYSAPPPPGVRYGAPPPSSFNRRNTMGGGKPDYHSRGYYYNQHVPPMAQPVPEVYKVTLHVGERTFLGEGHTLQAARHDAAARALEVLKPLTPDTANAVTDSHNTSIDSDDPNSELKSPISLVHEMALKRKLSVQFEVHGEKGPPHMKVFTTLCKVGTIVTEGEGNGKKLSKKRAAEKMLDELRKLPPASPEKNTRMLLKQKRKVPLPKKKTRNLIKDKGDEDPSGMVNPISRLMQIQQARKEKEPVYTLLEERGVARRREFIMEVSASGKSATGVGPTKKLAKKEAAENLLVMLGYGRSVDGDGSDGSPNKENMSGSANEMVERPPGRKIVFSEGGGMGGGKGHHQGGGGSSGRQIVPGVLQLNSGISNKPASGTSAKEPPQESNVSVESNTSAGMASTAKPSPAAVNASSTSNVSSSTTSSITPAATTTTTTSNPDVGRMKEQLMYLAQLLKFDVIFSDFPKGNHGEYLTLVTLSTEPPQLCHGSGASLEESHDEAARGALEILSKIGLDNVKPKGSSSAAATAAAGDESKSKAPLSNGLKK